MSNIGMMDGAFFVGRKEIMDWVNSTLDINLAKIEDTASGAVACQLFDIMHPGVVPMHKVDWTAKKDFEFVGNYKILQSAFTKMGVEKRIDVDRLISGRYMDNLEFMQWFKRFFELSGAEKGDYDTIGQRSKGRGGNGYGGAKSKLKPSSTSATRASATNPIVQKATNKAAAAKGVVNQENAAPTNNKISSSSRNSGSGVSKPSESNGPLQEEVASLRITVEESTKALNEMKSEMDGLEKERDFYFEKLRDIEIMMQDIEDRGEGNDMTATVFKVLYATKDGFETVVEDVTPRVDAGPEQDTY